MYLQPIFRVTPAAPPACWGRGCGGLVALSPGLPPRLAESEHRDLCPVRPLGVCGAQNVGASLGGSEKGAGSSQSKVGLAKSESWMKGFHGVSSTCLPRNQARPAHQGEGLRPRVSGLSHAFLSPVNPTP